MVSPIYLITVNDADGDTIQSIRVAGDDYGPGNIDVYSVSQRGYLDGSDTLNELPSLSDLYMRGTSAFVEAQFTLELYDGIEWSAAENMSFTFGTNLAPELRSVTDDSVIEGSTLNTTIRTNERRALSVYQYISYWDVVQAMMMVAIHRIWSGPLSTLMVLMVILI